MIRARRLSFLRVAASSNPSVKGTSCAEAQSAPYLERVRRAWRVTSWVKVLWPGFRRAEGKEKGKGVVVRRGLKEVQSETAGR